MRPARHLRWRGLLVWICVALLICLSIGVAAFSPLLAWRDPVYIAAGFAGIIALALLLVQPLLARGHLPGLSGRQTRLAHRTVGVVLLGAVLLHVTGLWITSPPDVIDVLLFASPTPFSVWGNLAMWAMISTALLAASRRWFRLGHRTWVRAHTALAVVIVGGSAAHAMLIVGTMEFWTKAALCIAVVAVTVKVILDRWPLLRPQALRKGRGR